MGTSNMGKVIVVLKAILTRVIFGAHGFIAIWRVTAIKQDPYYWYLLASILALCFEGVFTLTIKKNQEWKWFCPSVFFYLCSVVPAIWLIEVDKFDRKLALQLRADEMAASGSVNLTAVAEKEDLPGLETFGVELKIPVQLDAEMWATVIEQFLMLILIIGRWMLPKGGLTRDQLSQLLLVYIGTAADIIEFFDSFKDDKISRHRILCLLILSIWSWSLLQFTFVLTATKARARTSRISTEVKEPPKLKIVNGIIKVKEVCCTIDVWAILINIILQDAPFLIFRALLILYYKIISYMNIFFTCKNTLVIILQFYRLYVVQQEKNKELSKMTKAAVSKNVANAVERAAARMGPPEGRARLVKNAAAGKRTGKGPSSKQSQNRNKNRSQDSISSQNTSRSASRRDRSAAATAAAERGRRRSLSTGNLPEVGEGETFEDRIYEDDLELGMSGSALSGTNDPDSQEEDEESEVPLDEVSIASEVPRGPRKNIRMSENPGIFKISGSRSSGSSDRGHGRYRQDTGYSSSSKDSGNSGGRRGRPQHGGGGGGGRHGGRPLPNNHRPRSTAQRRRQFVSSKYDNSIEIGDYEGILLDQLGVDLEEHDPMLDNERLWQRRSAIGMVFFLFVVIFLLCMVAIYGGINPRGLVLRENFRIRETTRPTTTTTEPPSTAVAIANLTAVRVKIAVGKKAISGGVPAASVSPAGANDTDNDTVEQSNFNFTSYLNETLGSSLDGEKESSNVFRNDKGNLITTTTTSTTTVSDTDIGSNNDKNSLSNLEVDTKTTTAANSMAVTENDRISPFWRTSANDRNNGESESNSINNERFSSAGSRTGNHHNHNLRHSMSRLFRFVSEGDGYYGSSRNRFRKLSRGTSSFA